MRDEPTAVDLLQTARQTLMDSLLPALASEHRYTAHLIGAAMAIAAREAETGAAAEDAEATAISDLLGQDGTLEDLNRAFAAAIREGRLDTDHRSAAHAILTTATLAKLQESRVEQRRRADRCAAVPCSSVQARLPRCARRLAITSTALARCGQRGLVVPSLVNFLFKSERMGCRTAGDVGALSRKSTSSE